jgi:predicted metalloprotease with PDZ domain
MAAFLVALNGRQMIGNRAGLASQQHLAAGFRVEPDGLRVRWHLTGVHVEAGGVVAQLPWSIAGAPKIDLTETAIAASDDHGRLELVAADHEDEEGIPIRHWTAQRATTGGLTVDYLARPVHTEPLAATPPLELRRESGGLSGALKCFLVLPPGPEDLTYTLRWNKPLAEADASSWTAVTSWGEEAAQDGDQKGHGLEALGDTYMMCGDLSQRHVRDGQLSIWWLTQPGIDVTAFMDRLGTTYQVMSETFEVPCQPFRVFFRTHPHRGANGSAHPASFVLGMNPEQAVATSRLYESLAHELVQEWLRLDGPDGEVRWFNEGAADYYSLMVPFRAGLLDHETLLESVNLEARAGYANPRRHLTMTDAEPLFFTDFFAHWLPYTRGMVYLADLNARLKTATSGRRLIDDVVVEVTRRRSEGERIGIVEWCLSVDRLLAGDERQMLDLMVFAGAGRPGPDTFAPQFEMFEDLRPSLEFGFDPLTLVTGRVMGLLPGGPADQAGLHEGETVEAPGFYDVLALSLTDLLTLQVTRNGRPTHLTIPTSGDSVSVPQWRLHHTGPARLE